MRGVTAIFSGSTFIVTGSTSTSTGSRPERATHIRGCGKGVGGDEHLVARIEAEGEHGHVERSSARRDRERVAGLARAGELGLEVRDDGALREHPGLEDGGDRRELVLADLRPPEADSLFYFALYHSIVLASPSSSSTLGSQPSSSRAFSTFGMRSSTST